MNGQPPELESPFMNMIGEMVRLDHGVLVVKDRVVRYTGLKNLGATCYVNSMVQQLFMIGQMRQAILDSECQVTIDNTYNVQYQTMKLFTMLEHSDDEYVSPAEFITSIHDLNGQVIAVNQQQDAQEFLNVFLDKLDTQMKMSGNGDSSVISGYIGGILAHEIISVDQVDSLYKESSEPFFTIPVQIMNNGSLPQALDQFVQPELLDGDNAYYSEQHGQKIKVHKKVSIKSLPQTLIITLKRFEFDLHTMARIKVNDHFTFPMVLDMAPYTQCYTDNPQPILYNLTGTLNHSGGTDSGHYYSYIKDMSDDQWWEFNDTKISPFPIAKLAQQCFGGSQVLQGQSYPINQSSYLLFYSQVQSSSAQKTTMSALHKSLKDETISNNGHYQMTRLLLHPDNLTFINSYLNLYTPQQLSIQDTNNEISQINQQSLYDDSKTIQYFKCGLQYYCQIIVKMKEIPQLQILKQSMQDYYPCNFYLLSYYLDNPDVFILVMILNPLEESNKIHAKLLTTAIKNIYKKEQENLSSTDNSLLLRFLQMLLERMYEFSQKHARQMVYYYQVIKYILQQDARIIDWLMQSQLYVPIFKQFTNQIEIQVQQQSHQQIVEYESYLLNILELAAVIIRGQNTLGMINKQQASPVSLFPFNPSGIIIIDEIIQIFQSQQNFIKSLLPFHYQSDILKTIIIHFSFGDIQVSCLYLSLLVTHLTHIGIQWNQVDAIAKLIEGIILLTDNGSEREKVHVLLRCGKNWNNGSLFQVLKNRKQYDQLYVLFMFKWIAELFSSNDILIAIIQEYYDELAWAFEFIRDMENNQQQFNKQVTYLAIVLNSTQNKLRQIFEQKLNIEQKYQYQLQFPFHQVNSNNMHSEELDNNINFNCNFDDSFQQNINQEEIQKEFWDEDIKQDQDLIISIQKSDDIMNHSFN